MVNEKRIQENLETFSFPRLSGTEGEAKAFKLLKNKITDLNLTPSIQEFSFSSFYSRIYPKIVFSLAFWLLLILYLNIEGFFTLISLLALLLIFTPLVIITRKPEKIRIGKKFHSQNLSIKISLKPKEENSDKNSKNYILIFSHVDSKGQRFPVNIRILSLKFWFISVFISFIIIFLKNFLLIQFLWLYLFGVSLLGINLITTFFFILNTTNNKSTGAIDNASGVICVLELLNHFSEQNMRLKNYNLLFVFTGAEECGTMGIRRFYDQIKHLNRDKSFIINFDAIGRDLGYFSSYINPNRNYELYNVFLKNAEKLDLKFNYTKASFGIRSDGLYLRGKKFHGFGFGDLEAYKYVHTVNDTIDKVDTNLLKKFCKFMTIILQEIDNLN